MLERKDVPESMKWKLSDIFPSDEAWEAEFKAVNDEYSNYDFSVFKGKLSDFSQVQNFTRSFNVTTIGTCSTDSFFTFIYDELLEIVKKIFKNYVSHNILPIFSF